MPPKWAQSDLRVGKGVWLGVLWWLGVEVLGELQGELVCGLNFLQQPKEEMPGFLTSLLRCGTEGEKGEERLKSCQ